MKRWSIVLFTLLGLAAPLWTQQKFALVIGNGNYTSITKLKNPVNDANDMTTALQGLGFTVDKVLNGSREQMENAAIRLKNRLSASKNSYGFLFYAGHGVQSNGENYLIPVDASIPSESFLRDRTVSVQAMLDELNSAGNELNVVVLDACRDNPFSWKRSGSRGLQVVSGQPADSIIVYATSAGSTAEDGTGRNGLFTTHLLTNLKKPGIEVKEIFNFTGADVSRASGRQQIPAVYNQFFGTAYLGSRPNAAVVTPPPTPVQPATPRENPRPVPANMVRVEGGTFQMGSNNGDEHYKPHSVTVKSFYMGKYPVTQKEWYEVMGTTVRQQRDIASKNYSMWGEGENYPMYYVSWNDVLEYCNRRSIKEGLTPAYRGSGNSITCDWNANGYRLPTEAEWEYAAKGGVKGYLTTEYSGSNSIDEVAWYKGNSGKTTHAVGSKAPNELGIYDMSGNVSEWCWDWYGLYSSGAQTNPVGLSTGSDRTIRGGDWNNSADYARSIERVGCPPSQRSAGTGFRLARF